MCVFQGRQPKPLIDRLLALVTKLDNGCWQWNGALDGGGYGHISMRKVKGKLSHERAHRIAFMMFRGEIPKGLELDHVCRNRRCVNPGHLEPVSHLENVLRGESIPASNARKLICVRGHSLEAGGYKLYRGRRVCLECDKLRMQRITAKRRLSNKKRMFFIDKDGNYTCIRL